MHKSRKNLSPDGLWTLVHTFLTEKLPDVKRENRRLRPTVLDSVMSCCAVFNLKFPSLLKYEEGLKETKLLQNLRRLFHVKQAPSDTTMREHLDELEPDVIRGVFKEVFAAAQRGKLLEPYVFWEGHYLVAGDATQHFSSKKVHCNSCCQKKHIDKESKEETITYHHNMLGAVLVHPDMRQVIPLCPEPITKQDGKTKNDCEQNAAKRLIPDIRREHPHLKIIMVEDALYATGPHLELLKENNMRFIINAKEGNLGSLFNWVKNAELKKYSFIDRAGTTHEFQFINDVPLNESHPELRVNFVDYWETKKNGKRQHMAWITDLPLSEKTVEFVMRGGRARWHIENETFNTLKNQGYNFEHNFGHGEKNLCTIMALLMMLAFLVDQIAESSNLLFQHARSRAGGRRSLWEHLRMVFQYFVVKDWDCFYNLVITRGMALDST